MPLTEPTLTLRPLSRHMARFYGIFVIQSAMFITGIRAHPRLLHTVRGLCVCMCVCVSSVSLKFTYILRGYITLTTQAKQRHIPCTPVFTHSRRDHTLKRKGCHVDFFVVTGCTWCGHHDHFKCSQWLQIGHHDHLKCSQWLQSGHHDHLKRSQWLQSGHHDHLKCSQWLQSGHHDHLKCSQWLKVVATTTPSAANDYNVVNVLTSPFQCTSFRFQLSDLGPVYPFVLTIPHSSCTHRLRL